MQSQRFADDEAEQARLRNIQLQQHAHTQKNLHNLKEKQEMSTIHQQQFTAPKTWAQQTGGGAPQQQYCGGGISPQQFGVPQSRGFCGTQSPSQGACYQSGGQQCGGGGHQQYNQSYQPEKQQASGQQQYNQSYQPPQQQGGGQQQQFRPEPLYSPQQLQQQKYYADDDEEQRRLARIKQEQQQHEQKYLQSLKQHQDHSPRAHTFGTEFRTSGQQQYRPQQPRAGQLQSQQFADDEQEQARLKAIAEQQKQHTQRYHQQQKQHQLEAQNRNQYMMGGMDFSRR